jgi:hypothetical protein
VQVLAAYTEGARRGRAVVLLPTAEVVQVLQDSAGLTASGQERGVQLRMPTDRAPIVAAAIATARIFVVKAPGPVAEERSSASPPGGTRQPPTDPSDPDLSEPGTSTPDLAEPDASEPDASEPDASEPDASRPGGSLPGGQPAPTSPYPSGATRPTATRPPGRWGR